MNKKQAKLLRQFADRVTHAPRMTGPVRWEVAAYVDGEKQCVDKVFTSREAAERHVAAILRRNDAEQTNEVELRIDPVQ
jgi:hypothetical protein